MSTRNSFIFVLAKLLSIHPLFSLLIMFVYMAFILFVAALIWNNGHGFIAIIFVVLICFAAKSQSKDLIEQLKHTKALKHSKQ